MRTLRANFANELRKLTARRKYLYFLLFGLVICILSVSANIFIVRNTYSSMSDAAARIPESMLYIATLMFVPAVIFIAAGDLFAGEVYDGSLQLLLVAPISRMEIYVSKIFALVMTAAVFLAGILVSSLLLELAIGRTIVNVLGALSAYALDFVPLITVVMFAVLINQFSGGAELSIFLCAVLFMCVYAIQIFVPYAGRFAFTGYLVWHNLWLNKEPLLPLLGDLGVMLLYDIVFFILGFYKFKAIEI